MGLAFDIETNGFLNVLDKIHCINLYDFNQHKHIRCDQVNHPIEYGVELLEQADSIAGHNIINFDIPALQKVYPQFNPQGKILDTLIWSRCAFPNIRESDFKRFRSGRLPGHMIGRYSLEAWGYRLGVLKGTFGKTTDWQEWSPEMSEYCELDVTVTHHLLEKLSVAFPFNEYVQLEQDVVEIISRQERHGVLFDHKAAEKLYLELLGKREELREQIQTTFPPFWKRKGKLFTPNRTMRKRAGEWVGYVAGCKMQKIELVDFNPASNAHIGRMLMQKYDWIPHEFTDKEIAPPEIRYQYERLGISAQTTPKIDDEILQALPFPEAKPLSDFQMLNKRIGQLAEGDQAWLKCFVEGTGRIHGSVNTQGAVTGRMTHSRPNMAQVPASYSPYGNECRSLFIVPPRYKLVGTDADALEAVCKAHYLAKYDGGAFIKTILEGDKKAGTDVHTLNSKRLSFTGKKARDDAKTWYYAFMYGAGDLKLGRTAMENEAWKDYDGDPADLGKQLRGAFEVNFPGLKELIKAVKKASKRGYLFGLMQQRVPVRSAHSALNTLLQGAGAYVMKKALVLCDRELQAAGLVPISHGGLDYEFVLNVHDEYQIEALEAVAELVGETARKSIQDAAKYFNFRCPLDGSYDVGVNWKETH